MPRVVTPRFGCWEGQTWAVATWREQGKVEEYLDRVGRLEARRAGEAELVETIPDRVHRVLDLGCGDGRLTSLVLDARPELHSAIGLDSSPPMLLKAHERFAAEPRVTVLDHDLRDSLPDLGTFDLVVSGFAIHHVSDDRKRSLLAEIASVLQPSGVFVNLEVVRCATPELDAEFSRRIGRPGGDPEDKLAPVDAQLSWMRDAGLAQVDCYWRWRGFALLVGQAG
jgi:tRNA (cmo5U34)-methyltransferase